MDAYLADIYAYHLEHPKKSQWQVSLAFRVSKGTVIKKPMSMVQLGMLLKKAGYTQKCLSGKASGWLVRERGLEEVNANRNINARL